MSGSDQRDEELEALRRELSQDQPYIEKPDERQIESGALCFLDRTRVCGPDCPSHVSWGALPEERCQFLIATRALTRFLQQSPDVRAVPPPPNPFGAGGRP